MLQCLPGWRHWTVTVGPGRSTVTVTVGPGRGDMTVTVGSGTRTLTVTVGSGVGPLLRPDAPSSAGTVIAMTSANPMVAAISSDALDRSRFRSVLRCLLPGRGAFGVITPLMVEPCCPARAGLDIGDNPIPTLAGATLPSGRQPAM